MSAWRQRMKRGLSVLILVGAAIPLWACGETFEVGITVAGTTATGTVEIDGEVKTFEGTVDDDGCVEWDIDGCTGRVCGCEPGSNFKVTCKDPLLAQWPDAWTLVSATWTLPDSGLAGNIEVTPASDWVLPPEFGTIVTDPGHSAWVLKLDAPGDVGPGSFVFDFEFDLGDPPVAGCIKALDIATVEYSGPASCPANIVPTDPTMGVDFTVFGDGDPNVFCVELPTPSEEDTWGRLKQRFK